MNIGVHNTTDLASLLDRHLGRTVTAQLTDGAVIKGTLEVGDSGCIKVRTTTIGTINVNFKLIELLDLTEV